MNEIIKHKFIIAAFIGILCLSIASANYVLPGSNSIILKEITFKDPNNSGNYITFYPPTHLFEIHQSGAQIITGSYTEMKDCYSLKYDQGFGQVAQKSKNGVISPKGNEWIKV
jgi:hypothetical protein